MSYWGKVVVAISWSLRLWHKCTVLSPPKRLVEDIQRNLVDFFWSGKHWVWAAVLYLLVAEWGQGLIDIHSKIAALRFQTAQRLLYSFGPGWIDMARLLLRKAGRLGYDKQLFLLHQENMDLCGLSLFYCSVLEAWQIFCFKHVSEEKPGMWLFEEPLFFNGLIPTKTLQFPLQHLNWTGLRMWGGRRSIKSASTLFVRS